MTSFTRVLVGSCETITQDDAVAGNNQRAPAKAGDGKTHEPLENFNLLLHFQVLPFQHRNSSLSFVSRVSWVAESSLRVFLWHQVELWARWKFSCRIYWESFINFSLPIKYANGLNFADGKSFFFLILALINFFRWKLRKGKRARKNDGILQNSR